ncbi:MAG TPA: hypothetical protein PLS22_07260, partial [Aquabacterium sp.]|nr:hypothetical protein [Aquabacterium sp.]
MKWTKPLFDAIDQLRGLLPLAALAAVAVHPVSAAEVKPTLSKPLDQRIADGDVPSFLADKRILALDLSLIVAGTKYRG